MSENLKSQNLSLSYSFFRKFLGIQEEKLDWRPLTILIFTLLFTNLFNLDLDFSPSFSLTIKEPVILGLSIFLGYRFIRNKLLAMIFVSIVNSLINFLFHSAFFPQIANQIGTHIFYFIFPFLFILGMELLLSKTRNIFTPLFFSHFLSSLVTRITIALLFESKTIITDMFDIRYLEGFNAILKQSFIWGYHSAVFALLFWVGLKLLFARDKRSSLKEFLGFENGKTGWGQLISLFFILSISRIIGFFVFSFRLHPDSYTYLVNHYRFFGNPHLEILKRLDIPFFIIFLPAIYFSYRLIKNKWLALAASSFLGCIGYIFLILIIENKFRINFEYFLWAFSFLASFEIFFPHIHSLYKTFFLAYLIPVFIWKIFGSLLTGITNNRMDIYSLDFFDHFTVEQGYEALLFSLLFWMILALKKLKTFNIQSVPLENYLGSIFSGKGTPRFPENKLFQIKKTLRIAGFFCILIGLQALVIGFIFIIENPINAILCYLGIALLISGIDARKSTTPSCFNAIIFLFYFSGFWNIYEFFSVSGSVRIIWGLVIVIWASVYLYKRIISYKTEYY